MTITEEYRAKRLELRQWYLKTLALKLENMSYAELALAEGTTVTSLRSILTGIPKPYRSSLGVKAESVLTQRNGHSMLKYGCSWEEFSELTGLKSFRGMQSVPLIKSWWHHRKTAQRMKNKWTITLPEYAQIVTPYLGLFGRQKNSKVFAKINKDGIWEKDNVHVVSLSENSFNTKGFKKAQLFNKNRRLSLMSKACQMQEDGIPLAEIAKKLKISKPYVNNLIASSKPSRVDFNEEQRV